nr:trypsin-like serine protease [Rhizobium leguminosarum]
MPPGNNDPTPTSLTQHSSDKSPFAEKQKSSTITPLQKWFAEELTRYTTGIRSAFAVPGYNDGTLLTTTTFPSAGRLLRRPKGGGDISSCSGALVGSRHFLTAAHCFCEKGTIHWPDFKTCIDAGAPDKAESLVSFPTAGIYFDVMKITLNPEYKALDLTKANSSLGDIAVIELADDVPLPVISLDAPSANDIPMVVGFGVLDLTSKARERIGIPGGPYSPGIAAVFFPLLQSCNGQLSQRDVLCANYSAFNLSTGSATCGGDSGGALFKISNVGRTSLIGVASSRISLKGEPVCDANDAVLSVFTNVGIYRSWIQKQIGTTANFKPQNRLGDCGETVASLEDNAGGELSVYNSSEPAYLSVTGAGFFGQEKQPLLSEEPARYCVHPLQHEGLLSCKLPADSEVVIRANGTGILQITSCHQLTFGGPR